MKSVKVKQPPVCVPRELLNKITAENPKLWRTVDAERQKLIASGDAWPQCCFLPACGWSNAIVGLNAKTLRLSQSNNPNDIRECIREFQAAQFFGSWRITQGVYRFDPTLFQSLLDTPITGAIPVEVLTRLPEWAVYIETPGINHPCGFPLIGFGAMILSDAKLGDSLELHLFTQRPNNEVGRGLHQVLLNRGTIEESAEALDEENQSAPSFVMAPLPHCSNKVWNPFVAKLLSLLLWLCSEAPEIGSGCNPTNPLPKKTRKGIRFFPADQPKVWNVGVRIGAELRKAIAVSDSTVGAEGASTRPRGHFRRAHWHTYRIGTRGSDKTLKWLSPILVNLRAGDEFPATIRKATDQQLI